MRRTLLGLFAFSAIACGADAAPPATSPPIPSASPSTCTSTSTSAITSTSTSAPASTDPPPLTAIESAGLTSTHAIEIGKSLADEVGPRLAGSAGDPLARAWADRTMKDLGFENVHAEAVTVPVWKRGAESAEMIAPVHQALIVTALGWSGATPKDGITADVMEVDSEGALMKLEKDSAKGKIVFANVIMPRTNDGHGYGMTVGVRGAGPKAAMNAGAVAFLTRTIGTASDRFPHAGSTMLRDVPKPIPAGALSTVDADLLAATIARTHGAKVKLTLTPSHLPDAQSANIVGEYPGTTKKDEVIVLGAHLDSWDLARGAIDDGAGCSIVLEAARLVHEHGKTARTVRVVLFAAEENSVAGAKAYFTAHAQEAGKIVLAMEADSGTDAAFLTKFLGDPSRAPAFDAIATALLPLGIKKDDGDARPGTDISPLVNAGVPTIEIRQDASHYFDIHHSANDTSDKLDAHGLAQVASAFAEVVARVADADSDLGRVPESKRKAE